MRVGRYRGLQLTQKDQKLSRCPTLFLLTIGKLLHKGKTKSFHKFTNFKKETGSLPIPYYPQSMYLHVLHKGNRKSSPPQLPPKTCIYFIKQKASLPFPLLSPKHASISYSKKEAFPALPLLPPKHVSTS